MALELAGRFHAAADHGKMATYYLTEALYAYLHIGAKAKASALLGEHPDYLRAETRVMQVLNRNEMSSRGTTSSSGGHTTEDHVDVNSVLRAFSTTMPGMKLPFGLTPTSEGARGSDVIIEGVASGVTVPLDGFRQS